MLENIILKLSDTMATILDQINVEELITERKGAVYKFLKEQVRKDKEIKQVMVIEKEKGKKEKKQRRRRKLIMSREK